MNRRFEFRAALSLIALGMISQAAAAASYEGKYQGTELTVVIAPDGANYNGQIVKGDQTFSFTARSEGDHLSGTFVAGQTAYPFTATQSGDDLTLSSGGVVYQMRRRANPLAAGPQVVDALAGYTVMNNSDVGRSLVREVPGATTTRQAMQATFPDLARFFGGRPTIVGAYEDQRDHKSSFVSFTAKLNDQPINGFVTTKMRDHGAVIFVVYGRQNATRAEWAALTAHPAGAKDTRTLQQQMDEVPLSPYTFPDGTGAVGVADGWTTKAQTESGLVINGPTGQVVRMAVGGTMYTPDNWVARQNMQNGGRLNLPIAQYNADPGTALANFIRANSAVSGRNGGPTWTPDKLISQKIIPPRNQGGHAAQVTYDQTLNDPAGAKHSRVFCQFEVSPPVNGTWNVYIYFQLFAPPETFEQDLPVMMAQAYSLNEDPAAVAAKGKREREAAKARADALAAANKKIEDANYARTQGVEANSARQSQERRSDEENETIKLRSITDFDEVIRGIRTVEDTQSGRQTSVSLPDAHDIVEKLNEQDPGRYREIPLRDEVYPLPGH